MSDEVSGKEHTEQEDRVYEDTRHEAHHHARPRVLWGVAAVLVVAAGLLVWVRWGEEIWSACTGDNGACVLDADTSAQTTTFERPQGF